MWLLLLLLLLAVVQPGVEGQTPEDVRGALNLFKNPFKGKGSYYGPGLAEHGTCRLINPKPAYSQFRAITMDVAMNKEQFFGSLACGMCLKVNHKEEGEFYAYVQDKCGGCGPGGLDLGKMGHGKPEETIQAVQCPVGNSPIQYKIEGNPWNWKVQVRNARVPISGFKVKMMDGSYRPLKLQHYGAFTGQVKLPPQGKHDVAVKLTSINGFEIDDVIPQVDYSLQTPHTGSAQVPLDSSLPKMPGDSSTGGTVSPGPKTGGNGGKTGNNSGSGGGTGKTGSGNGGSTSGSGNSGGNGTGGGKSEGPFSCTGRSDGTYGDPQDCQSFIKCANGHLFRFKCQGSLKFDLNVMNCNHANVARCAQ